MGTTNRKRPRRCRLSCRTFWRWLCRFDESKPVRLDEVLLRAIPNADNYYNANAPDSPVNSTNFVPHPNRDPDGLSFFRLDFVTAATVGKSTGHPGGVFVAQVLVSDL